jgi:hypothetical protein
VYISVSTPERPSVAVTVTLTGPLVLEQDAGEHTRLPVGWFESDWKPTVLELWLGVPAPFVSETVMLGGIAAPAVQP